MSATVGEKAYKALQNLHLSYFFPLNDASWTRFQKPARSLLNLSPDQTTIQKTNEEMLKKIDRSFKTDRFSTTLPAFYAQESISNKSEARKIQAILVEALSIVEKPAPKEYEAVTDSNREVHFYQDNYAFELCESHLFVTCKWLPSQATESGRGIILKGIFTRGFINRMRTAINTLPNAKEHLQEDTPSFQKPNHMIAFKNASSFAFLAGKTVVYKLSDESMKLKAPFLTMGALSLPFDDTLFLGMINETPIEVTEPYTSHPDFLEKGYQLTPLRKEAYKDLPKPILTNSFLTAPIYMRVVTTKEQQLIENSLNKETSPVLLTPTPCLSNHEELPFDFMDYATNEYLDDLIADCQGVIDPLIDTLPVLNADDIWEDCYGTQPPAPNTQSRKNHRSRPYSAASTPTYSAQSRPVSSASTTAPSRTQTPYDRK